jgi:DNA-binding NarL/FixJ family response regulator
MTETRVLLADDHAVLRAGLRLLLEGQPGLRVVGEAGDGREALQLAEALQPDLILLDLTMPDLGGLAALPLLRRAAPAARILILTMHDDESYLRQALRSGGGYVVETVDGAAVGGAPVARGGLHSSIAHQILLEDLLRPRHRCPAIMGCPRRPQREVLLLVPCGHTAAEIASLEFESQNGRDLPCAGWEARPALARRAGAIRPGTACSDLSGKTWQLCRGFPRKYPPGSRSYPASRVAVLPL